MWSDQDQLKVWPATVLELILRRIQSSCGSARTISVPSGTRETGISLKFPIPNGMPMIVRQSRKPVSDVSL